MSALREARRRAGLSQRAVANRAGMSIAHLAALEGGRAPLSFRAALRLGKALGVPAGALVTRGSRP